MKYHHLGKTSLIVSELCFGTLTISPLQANLPAHEGKNILEYAFDQGINFFDTADLYGSYKFFKKIAISKKQKMVIASKSYAVDYDSMMKDIEIGLKAIQRDYFDIFKLHEQESLLTLKGHQGALDALIDAKKNGKIKAVGISTHSVSLVKSLLLRPEIEIIHPLFNYAGHGYLHGTVEEMEGYLHNLCLAGKGIYVMKPFGGGRLSFDFLKAFYYVKNYPYKHSIAVGMKTKEEVKVNVALMEGTFTDEMTPMLRLKEKKLFYKKELCAECYSCMDACSSKLIQVGPEGGIVIDHESCILCGYCLYRCPHLALRLL